MVIIDFARMISILMDNVNAVNYYSHLFCCRLLKALVTNFDPLHFLDYWCTSEILAEMCNHPDIWDVACKSNVSLTLARKFMNSVIFPVIAVSGTRSNLWRGFFFAVSNQRSRNPESLFFPFRAIHKPYHL